MRNLFYLVIMILAVVVTGCNSDTAGTDDPVDPVDTITADPDTVEHEIIEDKSQRPSPPDSSSVQVGDMMVKVTFGSPAVKGRTIWGELVPYGQVWRTGANEASTIEFSRDVLVNGKPVPAGKYGLFTIPAKGNWTVIINEVWDQWGAFEYEEDKDALRIQVTPKNSRDFSERMRIDVKPVDENTAEVEFKWGNMSWSFNVKPQPYQG